jgi:hypothetical protein
MSRLSTNTSLNGFDYKNQCWYQNGVYLSCGHERAIVPVACTCYGRLNAGAPVIKENI